MKLFEKEYDGESISDLWRDTSECFDERYNPITGNIPQDEHGLQKGKFKVVVTWEDL